MIKMSQINGVIVPAITFFDDNFKINPKLSNLLIRHIILNRANSIFLFGITGEGILFSNKIEEKIKYIDLTYSITEGKTPILVGIYGNEIDDILNQMEVLGKKFDSLNFVLTPPISEKKSNNELKIYFENLLDSVNLKNHIYFFNNPNNFAENEIEPEFIHDLVKFSNVKGIIDASDKINNYKFYIKLINENFSVYCGKPAKFSTFLQIVPSELRKSCGLMSSVANLVNICEKLYIASIKENILELHQLQEQLDDIRSKIYDIKISEGRQQRGLKHAILYLYSDLLSTPIDDLNIVSPELHRDLDDITKGRIEASVNYLINQKLIYQRYSLTKDEIYNLDEIINIFSKIKVLIEQGKIRKIEGPLDGKINTIYRVNFENSQLTFRFRTSKSFHYENIVKEKVLFPFLDGTLYPYSSNLSEKIKGIINTKLGAYIFNKQKPPIIPIANLIYYDETKNLIPYIFTIQDYIHGKPLYNILRQNLNEDFNFSLSTLKFTNLFRNIGEILGKLHEIKFDYFYENIKEIGKSKEKTWLEIFNKKLEEQIQLAKKNKLENIKIISDYFKDNEVLIEEENQPVLLHNDFQSQNIIVKEESGAIRINGLIDFDNWGIGVRAQDFIQIKYWDLKQLNEPNLIKAFYEGYSKYYNIDKEFKKKIEIYYLFWLLKLTNRETTSNRKSEGKKSSISDFLQKLI